MNYTKMGMNNEEYEQYVAKQSPKSTILKNCIIAFIIGGLICVIGQIITNVGMSLGLDKKTASTITTIILIFIAAFLTAIRVYEKIGKVAGAGTIVPITGFSNSMVSPAIEFKTEGLMLGIGANLFKVAGPVLVYGICSSCIIGFIYWIVQVFK
jgi:stage V sporulation protein AC